MISTADWYQMIPLLKEASSEDHENAHNYSIKKMEKRWDNYVEFNIIRNEITGDPIAFGGVYRWSPGLVRVGDRYYLRKKYRKPLFTYMPVIHELLPYQTRKYTMNECFFSVQTRRKRRMFINMVSRLDPSLGYTILDDLYWTSPARDKNSLQNIAATRSGDLTSRVLPSFCSTT